MRDQFRSLMATVTLAGASSFLVLILPAEVRAQTAADALFCPPGFFLQNGACTDDAGFSGAALASQALTELSQSTTQETVRQAKKGIDERRDQEKNRCTEGFTRVEGVCEPVMPPVREAAAEAVPQPAPPPGHRLKKAQKAKGAAIPHEEEHVPAPKIVRRERLAPAPKIVSRAAPPAMVCKDGPCAPPPPIAIEPSIRFAAWSQLYGDYEKRNAAGTAGLLTTGPGFPDPQALGLELNVHSQTGTIGFLAGADLTSRGVLYGNDGLIVGAMGGYVSSNLDLQTSSTPNTPVSGVGCVGVICTEASRLHARLAGPSAGLFATYFNGGFSTDVTLKVDVLSLSENFTDSLAIFAPNLSCECGIPELSFVNPNPLVFGAASTHLINATVAGNTNYRFDLQNNFWIEPTVGVQYTNSSYASDAAQLGLADGYLLMVQGGARFGRSSLLGNNVIMTATLTGLAYDNVLVRGGFIAGAPFLGNNVLAQADQGQVRGRGVLAFNFDFGQGFSSFVQGEARGGSGVFGAGGKAGVRYQW